MSKNIGVILGSTRVSRVGPVITKWLLASVAVKHNLNFEVIDLKDYDLPLLNEPEPAMASNEYVNEKTKAWSRKIASKDGFIFVTPQYNYGYPAALKNAIDYLYKEWCEKPTIVASYAWSAGGEASATQLKQVLAAFKLKITETSPAINFTPEMFASHGVLKDEYEGFNTAYGKTINNAISELDALFVSKPLEEQVEDLKVEEEAK